MPVREFTVNLPVRDLKASISFFGQLGFTFNPKFTDEKAACMMINDHAFVMLLSEPFFKTFIKKQLCTASTHTEGLQGVSCASRADVDELVDKAMKGGAKPAMDPQDHGFMYLRSFYDLDDHHWEFFWMDETAMQHTPGATQ